MLKSPPVNPRVYISWYYNVDPKEGLQYFLKYVGKSSKIRKKGQQWYMPKKRRSTKMLYVLNDKPRVYICQSYFLRPQSCKTLILEDKSDN